MTQLQDAVSDSSPEHTNNGRVPVDVPRVLQVRKRSGELVDYDPMKIEDVVMLCLSNGVGRKVDDITKSIAKRVTYQVDHIAQKLDTPISVEVIQDLVVVHLQLEDAEAAQAFRSYREEKRNERLNATGLFSKRTSFKPFEYPQFVDYVDAINRSYWTKDEWKFTADIDDFHTRLESKEQNAIKNALLAISQIEVAVKTFWGNLYNRMPKPEIFEVGATFAESEVRHERAYSHLLEILDLNDDFNQLLKVPAIRARVKYLEEALKPEGTENSHFAITIALFSMFIENCSLFSQFAVIKSFAKHRNMLKDVDNVVQATQREETLHAMFGAALIHEIKKERPEWFDKAFWHKMRSAARDAFDAECDIIDWIMEAGELDYLTRDSLKEFVKDRINQSFKMIGAEAVFEINEALLEPLAWFEEELKLDVGIDFFHTKSTAYSKHVQSYAGRDLIGEIQEPQECRTATIAPVVVLDTVEDREDYWWLNEPARAMLAPYLLNGQTPEQRIEAIADNAQHILGDNTFKARFMQYMKAGFYSLASPVWSNFGLERGLPISCFGIDIPDTIEGLLKAHTEIGMMSKHGGGTSGYYGRIRPRGSLIRGGENGESQGSINFMRLMDTLTDVISQGSTRRGQFAAYLPIDHPDFKEFLTIRNDGHEIQGLNFGACISDEFMEQVKQERDAARFNKMMPTPALDRWGWMLRKRSMTGYPYMFFTGNANRCSPPWYGYGTDYPILHSNLCTEIMLSDNAYESFVCCLSSVNVARLPEIVAAGIKQVVYTLVQFLDSVISEFITKAKDLFGFERSVRFAERHRALGMGVLGWHSYMQRHNLAIDTVEAHAHNRAMFRNIEEAAIEASQSMAVIHGEPEVMRGTGRRHTTLMAIAPTKSSSIILGQMSEGIEPWRQNIVVKKTQKGTFTLRNPELEQVLERYGRNDKTTWSAIMDDHGSVQNIDFLTEHEKAVFRTFVELPQMELITHAAERQQYIDQGQSLNLMIDPHVPAWQISDLYIAAYDLGIKSLYYQHGVNAAHQLSRNLTTCTSCEG